MSYVPDHRMERKAEAILNRLVAERQLSPEGKKWLINCLDPFHDTEMELVGHPDLTSSRSVTQCIQHTAMISPPAGSTEDWNYHVFFVPVSCVDQSTSPPEMSPLDLCLVNLQTNRVTAPSASMNTKLYSGVNVVTSTTDWASDTAHTMEGLDIGARFLKGKFRLLAVAYEIVDVSAEMYRSGSICAYKQPAQWSFSNTSSVISSFTNYKYCGFSDFPPWDEREASNFPNARIWPAKEGIYGICTLNDVENPPQRLELNGVVLYPGDELQGQEQCYSNMLRQAPKTAIHPFDNTGCIVSGLNQNTRHRITVRYFIETFPDWDNDLVTLAKPPAPYDPLALELYARCMKEMPSYCMVKENPLGEWFSKVMSVFGSVAPVVGRLLPFPGASLIGDGVGALAKSVAGSSAPASPMASSSKILPAKKTGAPKKKGVTTAPKRK